MNKKTLLIAALLFVPCLLSFSAHAEDVYTLIIRKQEKKEQSRWSLSQWLETRDRMRLMDLWLALNSLSPYEFFIGADYVSAEGLGAREGGMKISAAAYASIFGLGYERERLAELTTHQLAFNLRIFGYHVQGTNITLQGGLRYEDGFFGDTGRSTFAGVGTTIYLARHFGLEGVFRRYFQQNVGSRYQGGAFIDFRFVRVGAHYFKDYSRSVDGIEGGLKLFF